MRSSITAGCCLCETDTGEDTGYTVYNSTDPMEMWQWRPVRDDDVRLLEARTDHRHDYLTGPQIMEAVLKNTEGDSTAQGNPPDAADDAEGPTFLDFGTFAAGGVTLTGAPTDWPMTIAELASLLVSTGERRPGDHADRSGRRCDGDDRRLQRRLRHRPVRLDRVLSTGRATSTCGGCGGTRT